MMASVVTHASEIPDAPGYLVANVRHSPVTYVVPCFGGGEFAALGTAWARKLSRVRIPSRKPKRMRPAREWTVISYEEFMSR